jgi:hypothetical protein
MINGWKILGCWNPPSSNLLRNWNQFSWSQIRNIEEPYLLRSMSLVLFIRLHMVVLFSYVVVCSQLKNPMTLALIFHEFVDVVNLLLGGWFLGKKYFKYRKSWRTSNNGVVYLRCKELLMTPMCWFLNLLSHTRRTITIISLGAISWLPKLWWIPLIDSLTFSLFCFEMSMVHKS